VRVEYVAWCALLIACASGTSADKNPYNFYTSIAECTADRGSAVVCVDLALAIDSVSSCVAVAAPSCPHDASTFAANAACSATLDVCLATLFGASSSGSGSPPPDVPSDTGCGDQSCDPGSCEADGGSCDSTSCDDSSDTSSDGCSSSDGSSGCDGSGCDDSGESSCDSGGDGCSGDSGGDCGGGGGDCGGGGGEDCNAGRHHGAGGHMPLAMLWAALPIPFARRVKRRARKRRSEAS
jgi:hypothetical protein